MYKYLFIGALESKIGKLLCENGLLQDEIAQEIGCTSRHVRRAISNLKATLDAKNLAQLGYKWHEYKRDQQSH